MTAIRAITKPNFRMIGRLVQNGSHDILGSSRAPTYTLEMNHGIDTRFPQEKTTPEFMEKFHNNMNRLEYLHVLQSDQYSSLVKEELSKHVMYNHEEPCLVMYLKAGGFYSGTGFDDDDFTPLKI